MYTFRQFDTLFNRVLQSIKLYNNANFMFLIIKISIIVQVTTIHDGMKKKNRFKNITCFQPFTGNIS